MAKPIRLQSETLQIIHNGQLYRAAEVLTADWQNLPEEAFVFVSKSVRGTSYYCEREKGVLMPVLPGPTIPGRIVRNELAKDGPITLAVEQRKESDPAEVGYIKTSIYRIYYPLSVEALPTL